MKCCNTIKKWVDSLPLSHTIASQLVLGKCHTSRSCFQTWGATTLVVFIFILFYIFAKHLITLWFSISLRSRIACHICIQLITVIVLHPHKSLLSPLPELWFLLYAYIIPYMNSAFAFDTDPVTSSNGSRTRASINKWGMTAAHASSWLCNELIHLVNEWGPLDDAKQIVSKLNCSQNDVAGSRKTSKPKCQFALPPVHTYNLQNRQQSSSPLVLHRITVEDIFDTHHTCLE